MSKPFIEFRPAQVVNKKEVYVSYYILNPSSNTLQRKRVRFNHIKGKRERIKYARLYCLELNAKLYNGWNPYFNDVPNMNNEISLSTAATEFLKKKNRELRPSSVKRYKSLCKYFICWCTKKKMSTWMCDRFTVKHASMLMDDIEQENVCPRTWNYDLTFFKNLFNYLIKNGYVKTNPFQGFSSRKTGPKTRTIIPRADRAKIKKYFQKLKMSEYIIIMKLCYRCFIRPKEISMLKVGDINFTEGLLRIPSSVAKTHNERIIALPSEIFRYFNTLNTVERNQYIFSDNFKPGETYVRPQKIQRTWQKMRQKLQLPKEYQFYSLKDTGITEMLESGVPIKYVKELADHHSISMTERYTHRSSARKILEHNKLVF